MFSTQPLLEPGQQTSLGEALQTFVRVLGLDELLPPDDIPEALRAMEAELVVIGADAYRADVLGMALRDAVRDYECCPALAKLHASLEDFLTLGLPKELRDWARRLLARGVPPALDAMMRTLVRHARRDDNPIRRALCKLLVFEAVRFGLLLRVKLSTADTYAVGVTDADVDDIAERETATWMNDDAPWIAEVDSLDAITISGLMNFERHLETLRAEMTTAAKEMREMLDQRARFEARLFALDARDAILVRNVFADEFEIQRLSLELVRERHPAAFGDVERGAMDTRLSRLRKKPNVSRREPALIDLLRDAGAAPMFALEEE